MHTAQFIHMVVNIGGSLAPKKSSKFVHHPTAGPSFSTDHTRSATPLSASACGLSGAASTMGTPASPCILMAISSGTWSRQCTQPQQNICVWTMAIVCIIDVQMRTMITYKCSAFK